MLNSLYKSVRWGLIGALVLVGASGCSQAPKETPTHTPKPSISSGEGPSPDTALERKVFYYPDNEMRGERPEGVEEVWIETSDGLKLVGWQLSPPEGAVIGVYFHGNGGNISSLGGVVDDYRAAGLGLVLVDYRGFGKSEGEPSEDGLYLDGLATFDYARKTFPEHPILIHGRSLGGGVASYVAEHREGCGLILESSFTSTTEVARFSHGDKGAGMVDGFDTLSRLTSIEEPIWSIHGADDDTIPFFMSEELQTAARKPKGLWAIEGAGHNNVRKVAGEEYSSRLKRFAEECSTQFNQQEPAPEHPTSFEAPRHR